MAAAFSTYSFAGNWLAGQREHPMAACSTAVARGFAGGLADRGGLLRQVLTAKEPRPMERERKKMPISNTTHLRLAGKPLRRALTWVDHTSTLGSSKGTGAIVKSQAAARQLRQTPQPVQRWNLEF